MYSRLPAFVYGFHGCDLSTKEAVLRGEQEHPRPSINSYDWLGSGIYFWEQNPERAMAFAKKAHDHPKKYSKQMIDNPAVLGAVIDLGHCMNLMDSIHIGRLKIGYEFLKANAELAGAELPSNRGKGDRPLRELDRAVIEALHEYIKAHPTDMKPYDTVRGLFLEGDPVYFGAGFLEETHIQLCVRNLNCIKAFFDPRTECPNPFIC